MKRVVMYGNASNTIDNKGIIALSYCMDISCRYRNLTSIGLTRKEKEKLVADLYKQGLTYAQIAKEAHVSLRDISPILSKTGEYQSLSHASQVFKMLKEGHHDLVDIAIALNLREKEISEYYKEYWNLNGMYQLNLIYEEIGKEGIWSVIDLHRRTKAEGLTSHQATIILKSTKTFEQNVRDLEGEQARLEVGNQQAAETFQQFCDLIQKDRKAIEENHSIICQQNREIEHQNAEKARVMNSIDSIRLNDETFVRLKQIIKQEIENNILQPKHLLRIAIASIFESERKNPGKLRAFYYNSFPTLSVEQLLSQSSISENQYDATPFAHSSDSLEDLILNEAEQCHNRLIEAYADKCMNDIPRYAESSSIYDVSYIQNEMLGDGGYYNHEKPNIEEYLTNSQGNRIAKDNPNLETEQEIAALMSDLSTPPPNIANSYHQNGCKMSLYTPPVEPSSRKLIFDTRDLFLGSSFSQDQQE